MRHINPQNWNDVTEPMLRGEGLGGLLVLLFLLLVVMGLFGLY
jgi:hypothetical protein